MLSKNKENVAGLVLGLLPTTNTDWNVSEEEGKPLQHPAHSKALKTGHYKRWTFFVAAFPSWNSLLSWLL